MAGRHARAVRRRAGDIRRRDRIAAVLRLNGRASDAREKPASAAIAPLGVAILLRQRWGWFSTRGRSITFLARDGAATRKCARPRVPWLTIRESNSGPESIGRRFRVRHWKHAIPGAVHRNNRLAGPSALRPNRDAADRFRPARSPSRQSGEAALARDAPDVRTRHNRN